MNKKNKKEFSSRKNDIVTAWLFSAPAIILLLLFYVVPFFMAIRLSFTNQPLVPNLRIPTQFVGFRNYLNLISKDEIFRKAIVNNFKFAAVVVPTQTGLALFLAVLVNQKLKFANFFRTIYFTPVTITMVVVCVIWVLIFDASPEGVINKVIHILSFGTVNEQNWLGDKHLVWPAIMLMSIWQGVGFQMVIYLAGLQSIPTELYEAARVDGASVFQQFIKITIPQLRNTTIFVIVATTILAFSLFTQVEIMTNGGPDDATVTTVYYAFTQGFRKGKIGYGSAISVIYFLIVLTISLLQRFFIREDRAVE